MYEIRSKVWDDYLYYFVNEVFGLYFGLFVKLFNMFKVFECLV